MESPSHCLDHEQNRSMEPLKFKGFFPRPFFFVVVLLSLLCFKQIMFVCFHGCTLIDGMFLNQIRATGVSISLSVNCFLISCVENFRLF